MNIIKKLVMKDFLAFKAYKKIIISSIIMSIFFIIIGFADEEMEMVTYAGMALPVSILGGLSNSIMYEEEKANSDSYMLTFPVDRKYVVLSKYIHNILAIFSGIIIVLFIVLLSSLFLPINFIDSLLIILMFSIITNFIYIVKAPFVYKYSTEKANNILLLLMFLILSVISLSLTWLETIDPKFNHTIQLLTPLVSYIPVICFISIIIFNYISYKISYKIYRNKEF